MNTIFNLIKPGSKVRHKHFKLNGTVLSCINLYDTEDRLEQGPRYYVATSVDVWSIPQESLQVLEEGQGLSDYHRNRYAKYLISGFEISEFEANASLNSSPLVVVAPPSSLNESDLSGAIK